MKTCLSSLAPLLIQDIALFLLLGAAYGAEGDFRGSGVRGGELTLAIPASEIRTLNPLRGWDASTRAVLRLTAGTLTRIDEATGEILPGLAASWETDEACRRWTFRIRPGAKWSDGTPVTAGDGAFSIRAVTSPVNDFPVGAVLGRGALAASPEALDSATLRITLVAANPELPGLLADLPIVPEKRLAEAAANGTLATAWGVETRDPATAVTAAGPYRILEYRPGEKVVLAANPHYWRRDAKGQPLPYIQTVTFLLASDEAGVAERYASSQVDLLEDVDVDLWALLEGRGPVAGEAVRAARTAADFLVVNIDGGKDPAGTWRVDPARAAWLNSAGFRRVLAMVLDRKALAAAVPEKAASPLARLPWGGDPAQDPQDADVKESRDESVRVLKEAGWKRQAKGWTDPQGKKGAFTLLADTGAVHKTLAEGIKRQWEEFGFEVAIEFVPEAVAFSRVAQTKDFEVALVAIAWEPAVALERLRCFLDPRGYPLWGHPALAAGAEHPLEKDLAVAWERFEGALDRPARAAAADDIRTILVRELPMIALTRRAGLALIQRKPENLRPGCGRHLATWNLDELSLPEPARASR